MLNPFQAVEMHYCKYQRKGAWILSHQLLFLSSYWILLQKVVSEKCGKISLGVLFKFSIHSEQLFPLLQVWIKINSSYIKVTAWIDILSSALATYGLTSPRKGYCQQKMPWNPHHLLKCICPFRNNFHSPLSSWNASKQAHEASSMECELITWNEI